MPPHATSSFGGMAGKGAAPVTPPREPWKSSSRKSSAKVMPNEASPKQAVRRSKSEAPTPTKEPLKSCLKKRSEGGSSQMASSSPPLSHRSECTQLSMRSEFTESVFEQSSELHDGDGTPGTPKSVEFAPEIAATWSAAPSVVDDAGDGEGARRAFLEAFSRDEESVADSPHMGPYLLKLAKSYASGENPVKALEYCIRAVKFYERHETRENALDLVISLHILAALHCHLGQYEDAVALLQRSLTIPDLESGGEDHALASFSGHMQLGDTLNAVGKLAPSLQSYHRALDIQKSILGEFDTRVAETCTYIAEAHVQALEFLEARELCEHALVIHTEHCEPGSVDEASDHRLLAIIYSAQGEHGKALDSLVYANDIYVNFDLQLDVATGNQSIGDELLALGRDSEALQCFGKCVGDFKMLKGEHDALVASAHTSLADLFLRTNNPREAKVHCQNALQIYAKQGVGHVPSDVAFGLVNIASILEQLNEKETALLLLQRACNIQDRMPGQQATLAGLEAQIGVLQNMLRQFQPALQSFEKAVAKMKSGTLRNSPLLGLVINQMGVTCIELGDVAQAACHFEEAKSIMESTTGPHHLDTLDVCNNLACTYANLGRTEEARELLEEVVRVKEEKLGAVHPDVGEDRARLQALLSEGQSTTYKRSRKLVDMLTSARKAFHTFK